MLYLKDSPYAHKHRTDNEKHFIDENARQVLFPSLEDESTLDLSIIVPAYNEQDRSKTGFFYLFILFVLKHLCLVRPMLESCLHFLTDVSRKWSFEVIVVSDGSTDGTCDIVMEYVKQYGSDRIRLLKLYKNRGKGGAVCLVSRIIEVLLIYDIKLLTFVFTQGMQSARGRTLLFADADGATRFQDLEKLETVLHLLAASNNKRYFLTKQLKT